MAPGPRMSNPERKAAILAAVRPLLAEKGVHGVTTRDLAEAAGVSQALLFRHFPSKEALYAEAQVTALDDEIQRAQILLALPDTTGTLVFLTGMLLAQITQGQVPGGKDPQFRRMILTSLMEGGDFARQALQGMPSRMNRKLADCLEAAVRAGDARPGPTTPWAAGWFVNHVGLMLMVHLAPEVPIIDFGASREDLARQAHWFCLRGMGVTDAAIERCLASPPPPIPPFGGPPLAFPPPGMPPASSPPRRRA